MTYGDLLKDLKKKIGKPLVITKEIKRWVDSLHEGLKFDMWRSACRPEYVSEKRQ